MLQVCLLCNGAPFKVWISILPRRDLKMIAALLTHRRRNVKLNMIIWNPDDISVLQCWQTKVKRSCVVKIAFRLDWHFNTIDANIAKAVVKGKGSVSGLEKSSGNVRSLWSFGSLIPCNIKCPTMAKVEVGTELEMRSVLRNQASYFPSLDTQNSCNAPDVWCNKTKESIIHFFLQPHALISAGVKVKYEVQNGLQEFPSLASWGSRTVTYSMACTHPCYKSQGWDYSETKPIFCLNRKH